jgi:hypothetical protein
LGLPLPPIREIRRHTNAPSSTYPFGFGLILKRGGKLVALNESKVIAEARAALAGVRERAKWR